MAIYKATTSALAGERPRTPSSHVGPVTAAIRAMRNAEPDPLTELREAIERYFATLGQTVDLDAHIPAEEAF